ncbi:MAG TPA: polyphosphate polymerase domain-containing protein [Candidatus Cryosericum sp.]|nr:polyphosphate polymerase domain-containing protein [Candidatus Cryosericum sp.]
MQGSTFERFEEKYLLNAAQYQPVMTGLRGRMQPDLFGRSMVSSVYYDTADYRLIRASLEKPDYKEKLRVRAYGKPTTESKVFVELKKKYDGIVYKRRVELPLTKAELLLAGRNTDEDAQIMREIQYFLNFYRPVPSVFLSYRRVAYVGVEAGLRITIDDDIRFRMSALRLTAGIWGEEVLPKGMTLMEIKVPGAMPLWLCELLNQNGVYPASFSKYGVCYRDFIFPQLRQNEKGRNIYA